MSEIMKDLDKVADRLAEEDFLSNKGLSNEVGIHVFCYRPEEEPVVSYFFEKLKDDENRPFRLIECDLYKIFLSICEEKRIIKRPTTPSPARREICAISEVPIPIAADIPIRYIQQLTRQ